MSESQPWVQSPKLPDVPVNHGKGKSVVTGVVSVLFNGGGIVYVTTEAHHNDNKPCLSYRGHEWLASAHVTRQSDGTWTELDPSVRHGISQRGVIGWGKDTPKTYRAAIIAALCATVADVWTPDLDRQGTYATAAQQLHGLLRDRAKVADSLAALDARVAALRATLAATADPA